MNKADKHSIREAPWLFSELPQSLRRFGGVWHSQSREAAAWWFVQHRGAR